VTKWSVIRAKRRGLIGYGALRRWPLGEDRAKLGSETIDPGLADSELGALFVEHAGRLADTWTSYLPAYSDQFAQYREGFPLADGTTRPICVLEIGVSHGGSLQLWRKYFGPTAVLFGVDIDSRCSAVEDGDLNVRIGSQTDPVFLLSVVAEMGSLDIVIDDGSHHPADQRASFDALFPVLSEGGMYVVEDLHTAYWTAFKGGIRRRGTFIATVKDIIDDMHDRYHGRARRVIPAGNAVTSMAIYDGIVFVRKGPPIRSMSIHVGDRSF
jgi:hypothetical protein